MSQSTHPGPRGIGIGLRHPHFDQILEAGEAIDWLEIVPENFVGVGGRARRVLDACRERWPIVAHGVSLSLGGPDALDRVYLQQLRGLLDHIRSPYYTDHACWATAGGVNFYDLLPLPFSEEAGEHIAARTRAASEILERPIALENISYYATMPGSRASEGEFLRTVVDAADCELLLDVNNVYVNARNHGRDPLEVLRELPLDRARQIHVAGFKDEGDRLLDDHGSPVSAPVWDLLAEALPLTGPIPVLIEWDTNIPPLDEVLAQAARAREIYDRCFAHQAAEPCTQA